MDKSYLIKEISKPITKKEVVSLAMQSENSITQLINLCLHNNYEIAFRAAWVLEIAERLYPARFEDHIVEFIRAYLVLENRSSQRHFTKILMNLTTTYRLRSLESVCDLNPIIETTFEWMIDPQTPVAVRVNCMDILYNLKTINDWIEDELRAHIEFQLKNGSAALQSRGKKLLYKLSRNTKKS